jgi:hypothetical protein
VLIAATSSVAGPDLGVLANYGVLGLFTIILIGFAFRAWQRETARADRVEAELREKNQAMLDKVIPALTTAALAAKEAADLVRELADEREREWRRRTGDRAVTG